MLILCNYNSVLLVALYVLQILYIGIRYSCIKIINFNLCIGYVIMFCCSSIIFLNRLVLLAIVVTIRYNEPVYNVYRLLTLHIKQLLCHLVFLYFKSKISESCYLCATFSMHYKYFYFVCWTLPIFYFFKVKSCKNN